MPTGEGLRNDERDGSDKERAVVEYDAGPLWRRTRGGSEETPISPANSRGGDRLMDLRDFISSCERAGQLTRIRAEVDWDLELPMSPS